MAVAGPQRSLQFVQRDKFRHPIAELEFFGIKPSMTVVEIWPEGGYWTEIIAPYLHDGGTYYAAIFQNDWRHPSDKADVGDSPDNANLEKNLATWNRTFQAKLDTDKATYGNVKVVGFGKGHYDIAPPGSADMIVSFRNIHNWMSWGFPNDAFSAFYKALKPGGILGIEEHRGRGDVPQDPKGLSGYVRQDYAIGLAESAGFRLIGSSEINANPKDTKDWPKGVWTLPPALALGDKDRAKYLAIGEADNFVLKFQKPLK